MESNNVDVLLDAVARNAAVVLSLPSAGMLRHHKSRFLSQTAEGLWIEGAPEDRILITELITTGIKAGISFKTGTRMINFSTTVLRCDPKFSMNATTIVDAILIEQPKSIESVQRRNNYRVHVPAEREDLRTRLWRIPEHHFLTDRPQSALEMPHQVFDISVGGMGVMLLPCGDEPVKGSRDERIRIEVEYQSDRVVIEGRLRLLNTVDRTARVRAGVSFKKLEANLDGRRALALLTKAVGDLQREEIRRHHLGLKEAS